MWRSTILPIGETRAGRTTFALPETLAGPLRSVFGPMPQYGDREAMAEKALPLAGVAMGGGMAFAPRGAVGVFGGRPKGGSSFAAEKGGAGGGSGSPRLPMDQASRMKRAEEMGFDLNEPLYHGAATEFSAFDPATLGRATQAPSARLGYWSAVDPKLAGGFAENAAQKSGGNPQIYPLFARSDSPGVLRLTGRETEFDVTAAIMNAFDSGLDKILVEYPRVPGGMTKDAVVVKNPNQYRSAFAEFDPAKRDRSDLLASIAALLGVGGLGASTGVIDPPTGGRQR